MTRPWTDQQVMEFKFKERYTRFKIWFAMKNKNNHTFYGVEANCTALQIASGHIKEVLFDKKKSYDNCLYLEQRFREDYETAIIYEKRNKVWTEVAKYRMGQLVEFEEIDLSDPLLLTDVVRVGPNLNWQLRKSIKVLPAPQPEASSTTTIKPLAGKRMATDGLKASDVARKAYGFN
jgi:hypothetical protein